MSGEPNFDGTAARHMDAAEARGQSRRIVGDHQIPGVKEIDESGASGVADSPIRIDDQKSRVRWPLDWRVGCFHDVRCSIPAFAKRDTTFGRFDWRCGSAA